jgi:hypothetical protein
MFLRLKIGETKTQIKILSDLKQNFLLGVANSKISATDVILKKLAKENNRPRGENSPNLVTLTASKKISQIAMFLLLKLEKIAFELKQQQKIVGK